jgi:copper resistance protein B
MTWLGPRLGRRLGCVLAVVVGVASPSAAQQAPPDPHAGHQHPPATAPPSALPTSASPAGDALPPSVRPLTDADRAAAFPPLAHGHSVHDDAVHAYVLFDELEWRAGRTRGLHWDVDAWVGGDRDRLWIRAEGVSDAGALDEAHAHALYGRAIARWWDVVAGIRQDLRPGDPQTWLAFGVQGFAPYRIDVELTGYLGASGRTQLRADASHDLRLTRRLVAQTRLEATLNGKADPARHAEPGLASVEAGVRVRYEIRRELAPYVGITWQHEAAHGGDDSRGAQLTVGVRVWR